MKSISTSIYTFEELIKYNCLYIDKTEYIYKLISAPKGQFFMARPRRFGKSLTVSTLDAVFRGKKALFEGLYIYDAAYDWEEYPIIHLDFGRIVMKDIDELNQNILEMLSRMAVDYGIELSSEDAASAFEKLIYSINRKFDKGVVLLIDEYDKPILDHMKTPEEAEKYRSYMDSFYQVIKGSEAMLRFVFMTGVTKFAKVSVFSKLNNIEDISMREDYADMLGYTDDELVSYFSEYINDAVDRLGVTRDKLLNEIKSWYDGFRFYDTASSVYNPVSIGMFINGGYRFKSYWFSTGTPTFLIEMLKKNHLVQLDFENVNISESSFDTFDVARLAGSKVTADDMIQLLYQTGYLTIDKLVRSSPTITYRLRFPNREVSYAFSENLANAYVEGKGIVSSYVTSLLDAVDAGDTEAFIEVLKDFFAALPYDIHIREEKYYQSMVYVICKLSGMDIVTEVKTNIGRIDAVLRGVGHTYIIEFKLNKSADEALEQIDEKKYTEGFILPACDRGDAIHKLGINFCYSEGVRNITDWREEII